jgi:flagellar biosynthetic protein FliO
MAPLLAWAVEPVTPLAGIDTAPALRALLATAVVLGLVALLAWLVRRGTLAWPVRSDGAPVAIERAVPLGERRSLVIVAVEGRRLLLGLTPAQVTLVTELGPSPRFEAALDDQRARSAR